MKSEKSICLVVIKQLCILILHSSLFVLHLYYTKWLISSSRSPGRRSITGISTMV